MSKIPKLGTNKKKERIKVETYGKLKKALFKAVSDYVRERDNWTCITCGVKGDKSNIQDGHYIERSYIGTAFDERNNNAQCQKCNCWKDGNIRVYAIKLEEKYGVGILQELEELRRSNQGKKIPKSVMIEKIEYFKNKLSEIIQ